MAAAQILLMTVVSSGSSQEPFDSSLCRTMERKNVGILAMEISFPSDYVDQADLEAFDRVGRGKYTIGLGLERMAVPCDYDDVNSLCLTAVNNLLTRFSVPPASIGRLEVGSESQTDRSKSVKSVLMQLFSENTEIVGIDNVNACYGGTAALLNSLNWIEGREWDGRNAIVVAGDIAVYEAGPARPTGGAAAVAMLIGPGASLVFERGCTATHMEHAYDFYKPFAASEYPLVDGKLSIDLYLSSLAVCYERFRHRLAGWDGRLESIDFFLFHCPFTKLVQKGHASLVYREHQQCSTSSADCKTFSQNKELQLQFMALGESLFTKQVQPSLVCATQIGNSYCASLYASLLSLLSSNQEDLELAGKRVALFSYGSGLASSLFSIRILDEHGWRAIASTVQLVDRLNRRRRISPEAFALRMQKRERFTTPTQPLCLESPELRATLSNGGGFFYLSNIDGKNRREYSFYCE